MYDKTDYIHIPANSTHVLFSGKPLPYDAYLVPKQALDELTHRARARTGHSHLERALSSTRGKMAAARHVLLTIPDDAGEGLMSVTIDEAAKLLEPPQ